MTKEQAIIEALVCILKGMYYHNLLALDEKCMETRNNYIDSTIKLLEETNNG